MQRQQNQVALPETKLDKTNGKLEQLTFVYFPRRFRLKRLRILEQNKQVNYSALAMTLEA